VDLNINTNSLPSATIPSGGQSFDYTTMSLNARYAVIRDIFSVRASAGPTFGDFKRTAYDIGASWNAMPTMTFELQFSLFNNSGISKDTIWSLRYRYDVYRDISP